MKSRLGLVALAMIVLAALVAGCGGDDSDETTNAGTTGSSQESGGSGDVAKAEQLVADYEKTSGVDFPQPTESFDPGTGKIAVIACGVAGENCLEGSEEAIKAVKAMGWQPSPVLDGEFSPAKQAGYVQQAIQEGYDGIVLVSIDAQSIKSAVDAAAAKGIPITCVMCVNPEFEGKVYDATTGGIDEGKSLGAWVAANAEGDAKVLAYNDKSFPIVAVRRENAVATIEELCPDCEIEEGEFPTTDLEKPGSPTFEAALASNPPGTLQFVMSPYDPAGIPMAKAAEQSGRTDFKLTGYDASPEFVEMIEKGDGVAGADAAVTFPYCAWSAVDLVGRLANGKEPWDATGMPAALVTQKNAAEFLKTGGYFRPADFDFEAMFKKLWGKS